MRALKSAGAWLLLVGLMLGTPAALLRWGVAPTVFTRWAIADDGRLLLGALSALAWLAWGALALSIAAELVNALARRPVVRLPLLGGLQVLAASLVVAAFSASVSSGHASAQPRTTAAAVMTGPSVGGLATDHLLVRGHHESVEPPHPGDITVARGDTLSGLAREHLGSAHRWPEIYRANRDQIADPDLIGVGWRLVLPSRQHGATPDVRAMRPVRKPPETAVPRTPDVPGRPTGSPRVDSEAGGPTVTASLGSDADPSSGNARVETVDPTVPLVGAVGGLAAAMILGAVAVRRQAQLRSRPIGRRIAHPSTQARRYETALGHRERPEVTLLLERVLRTLGRHFFEVGRVPRLRLLTLDAHGLTLDWWDVPPRAPLAFEAEGERWHITFADAHRLPATTHPVPYPALVTLGQDPEGAHVLIDLEQRETLAVLGSDPEARAGVLAAWCLELTCSPWSDELHVTYVGDDRFVTEAGGEGLVVLNAADDALTRVAAEVAAREAAFPDSGAVRLARVNQDLSESSAATIVVFADELTPAQCDRLLDLIDGAGLGIAAVLGGGPRVATGWAVTEDDPVRGTLSPDALALVVQTIPASARRAIGELTAATVRPHTAAPWWPESDTNVRVLPTRPGTGATGRLADVMAPAPEGTQRALPRRLTGHDDGVRATDEVGVPSPADDPVGRIDVAARHLEPAAHPTLLLVGAVELRDTRGQEPSRSRRQCEEYCGWLLENPGRTATQMAAELVVAEGTRRSNMSRLRTWLGATEEGEQYLPEAYSGRITLHPLVSSDWQRIQLLAGPGLTQVGAATLQRILEFVRGAPLADAAPGQWHWAEELRTDMASLIRDAGAVLSQRARHAGDLDLARWAASRALAAAPEDEVLLVERIRTEHQAGDRREVERLVQRVTQQARSLGFDLEPDTIRACQEAMEGRIRARA